VMLMKSRIDRRLLLEAGAASLMLAGTAWAQQVRQGPWKIPGGGLTEADYRKAVETGGFTGRLLSEPTSRTCGFHPS
jgi:hypothetical protein